MKYLLHGKKAYHILVQCHFSIPPENVKDTYFLENFRHNLDIILDITPTKNNEKLNSFLPMAQNCEPGSQTTDGFCETLLYGPRHAKTGKHLHTFDFSCIDNDLLNELEKIKKQVDYCHTFSNFEIKLHLINDILINYGFFLKVYVLQKKKIRYLNNGN